MANAIGLLVAVPLWYLLTVGFPLAAGALTLVPAAGTLSLGLGVVLGAIRQRRDLLLFLLPFALSEILVGVAGAMRGQVRIGEADPALVDLVHGGLFIFMAVQVAISAYLVYLLKGARSSAIALAIFTVTYAAFAAFVATMSFSDTWL